MSSEMVDYHVICRDCFAYDGSTHSSFLDIEDTLTETDYSLKTKIVEGRDDMYPCIRCGSHNIEIFNIKCHSVKFYEFDRLKDYYADVDRVYMGFLLQKSPNSKTVVNLEATQINLFQFEKLINKIIDVISNQNSILFVNNQYGHFDIIVSAEEGDGFDNLNDFKIDKLSIYGFTREDILKIIDLHKEKILKPGGF
tara:strand:- start:147 stop:734 length:588 start_codon:yes stop_codon:yes gene_type:complete